jgi:hypothetical protein
LRLDRRMSTRHLLDETENVAAALRAIVSEPPMVEGRVVPTHEAQALTPELRRRLLRTLEAVAAESPIDAQSFASRWAWCQEQLGVALTEMYPLRSRPGPSLQWPKPTCFSPAQVELLVRREFADADAAKSVLAEYHGPEAERVAVDALRLARRDLDRLRQAILRANQDYRDTLSFAEFPSYFASFHEGLPGDRQHLIDDDHAAYLAWLRLTE